MKMTPRQIRNLLGSNVRNRRLALGFTLHQLGNAAGVSYARISQIEHGSGAAPVDLLAHLAEALDTQPAVLLTPEAFAKKKSLARIA
jgi:transcriptional regulator with XRE-family HTH domain